MSDLLDPGELPEAAVFIDKVPDFVERFQGGVRAFDDGSVYWMDTSRRAP